MQALAVHWLCCLVGDVPGRDALCYDMLRRVSAYGAKHTQLVSSISTRSRSGLPYLHAMGVQHTKSQETRTALCQRLVLFSQETLRLMVVGSARDRWLRVCRLLKLVKGF